MEEERSSAGFGLERERSDAGLDWNRRGGSVVLKWKRRGATVVLELFFCFAYFVSKFDHVLYLTSKM